MSYQIRVASAHGHYHVMSRGNNKMPIFEKDRDKEKFMEYLRRNRGEQGLTILAYCIMPNHYHLLIQADTPLAMGKSMQKINLAYTRFYQKKYNYIGHVFQGRYSSAGINTRDYLYRVLRYVHNNPVRSQLCKLPSEYPYSSYEEYIGRRDTDLLPENGLLLMEKMGFSGVASFNKFHGEKEESDFSRLLRSKTPLGAPLPTDPLQKELDYAEATKNSLGDYGLMGSKGRLAFAHHLLDNTEFLSRRTIAQIAEIDRHRL